VRDHGWPRIEFAPTGGFFGGTFHANVIPTESVMLTSFLLASALAPAVAYAPATEAPRYPGSIAGMEHTKRAKAATGGYSVDPTSRAISRLFYRTIFASSKAAGMAT
jgi:hypothetical protein